MHITPAQREIYEVNLLNSSFTSILNKGHIVFFSSCFHHVVCRLLIIHCLSLLLILLFVLLKKTISLKFSYWTGLEKNYGYYDNTIDVFVIKVIARPGRLYVMVQVILKINSHVKINLRRLATFKLE